MCQSICLATRSQAMPRFAANLAYLFTERAFMERFAAAAAAGFTAVELQVPYEHAPSLVKAELAKHNLTMLGINTPPGQTPGGEFGVAALPGREAEFAMLFQHALDYAVGIGARQIDRKSTRLNSSHSQISYAVFCLKKKKKKQTIHS